MLSPLSFPPETYSIKISEDNAPFCQVEGEPCGFFDISLNGNIHFDWIKSWCRCPATHECLFVEHDLRHKVYKFACMRIVEQQKYLYGNGQPSRSRNRIIVSRSRHGRRRSVK
uniref:SWIM-type domain-containing protein n=1 Tax=Meloidogyne incognita TaxID=6306 RepID=A0A914KUA0_MELIC